MRSAGPRRLARPHRLARPDVEVTGEQGRIAGPQAPVDGPRVAGERRREPAAQVRLVDVAAGDGRPHRGDASQVGRPVRHRGEGELGYRLGRRGRDRAEEALLEEEAQLDQAAIEGLGVAVEGAAAEPGPPGSPIPGDDAVIQPEPEERHALVVGDAPREPLEAAAEVVAEVADEPAEERRSVGHRAVGQVVPGQAPEQPSRIREGVRPIGRPVERVSIGSAARKVQRLRRPGRAVSSRARPGRSRRASAASIGANPSRAGQRSRRPARASATAAGACLLRGAGAMAGMRGIISEERFGAARSGAVRRHRMTGRDRCALEIWASPSARARPDR
jgi:hypothetical protein